MLRDYNVAEALQDRCGSLGEDDNRIVTDLPIDQIEFADVIVLNRLDLVSSDHALEVKSMMEGLNPGAKVCMAMHGKVPLEYMPSTDFCGCGKEVSSTSWMQELQGKQAPKTEEYGI